MFCSLIHKQQVDRLWRKNRRVRDNSSECVGVDLNRNFASNDWGEFYMAPGFFLLREGTDVSVSVVIRSYLPGIMALPIRFDFVLPL